ncbi:hypothetical protein SFRURICE_014347 [Spodoptera frugiperda]|nr:hypothetical protein SFRURICE_014347 [Spodoptera frugiperda]
MALYEGIALIQEKQAVVLDLGTDYTKSPTTSSFTKMSFGECVEVVLYVDLRRFGFTGEAAPRCIVRSEFWCPATRRYRRLHDYSSAAELYDNLVHMLHQLYFRHVLVNPKERKVVVVESLLTPTLFRETLAKVSGVVWADSPRLCALTLGAPAVLVVSIGAKDIEVAAVVHSCVVLHALQSQPLGARAVHAELARLLDEHNGGPLQLDDQTCFVTTRERAAQWATDRPPAAARDVRYGRVTVPGRARELAAEVMFQRDHELASLADAVLQCVAACPRDVRRALAAGVLAELLHLLTQPPYCDSLHVREFRFHSAPAPANAVAWLGGAVLGAGEAGAGRVLAREQYAREPRLRDWVCLLDNTPPAHPHRAYLDI